VKSEEGAEMGPQVSSVITRIGVIQRELEDLKRKIATPAKMKRVRIEGLWAGWEVPDELIEESKKAVFREAYHR
jgi:hypothetical protein